MPVHDEALGGFRLALGQGRYADAVALEPRIAATLAGTPGEAQAWFEIGHLYAEHWRFADAERALARAAALVPGDPSIHSIRASVRQELGDIDGALAVLDAASGEPPDLRIATGRALLLPQVYEDAADIAAWRRRYEAGVAALEGAAARFDPEQVFRLERGNFLLAYQGGDDLPLQQRYSRFLAGLVARAEPRWRAQRRAAFDGSRRLRVGFVGAIYRDCTAGRYFERWATGLDPRRFERVVFHTAPLADAVSTRIAAGVDRFEPLRATARETAERLEAEALDVIVYPEVGMDAMTYVLAALRLAPVQVAGWGHPVTTGSDAIDAFLTSAPMEPADAASHYTERLVPLPGLGVDYALPAIPEGVTRAAFGLPAGRRLYACPQSLFKIHPDMDAFFADILEGDTEGVLIFFQAPARAVTDAFGRRIQRTLAARGIPPRGQVKFLPRMGGRDFRALLAASDVVVDTAHWSGGNTSLDAFAAGTPVVTTTGRFMRGRQTAAMLDAMQLQGLVAADLGAAARTAIEVASHPDLRADLSEAIRSRRDVLFGRPEPVAALGEALLGLTSGKAG
jgi:predicted O-linked N-acetylglucosamine transferase (SPINDLY family)